MKIVFCGHMYDDAENEIKKMRKPGPISGHNYQIHLLNGLIKNMADVYVINLSNVNQYPDYPIKIIKKRDFIFNEKAIGKSIGFLNLRVFHLFSKFYNLQKEILEYLDYILKRNKNEKIILFCFNYSLPIIYAMYKVRKKRKNVYLCSSMGDLPGKYGVISLTKRGFISRHLVRIMDNISEKIIKSFDCFSFATKKMSEVLCVENKPFVVTECMYSVNSCFSECQNLKNNLNEKIIFYAGTLRASFGIAHLLSAFISIGFSEYRLWIAGDGEDVPLVKKYAETDKRIKYLGVLTPCEVNEAIKASTVMINPRIAGNYEYVKYSFPCKTLEGLASGKPYIAHRLPCDPPEYANYIQYADDESDEALARKIIEICSLSELERNNIGETAKSFVEIEKSPEVMTKKIIEMWESM